MKRVDFCEETEVYYPIMHGQAAYSDMKQQQRKERLQSANAAWQDMDTEFVDEKVTSV